MHADRNWRTQLPAPAARVVPVRCDPHPRACGHTAINVDLIQRPRRIALKLPIRHAVRRLLRSATEHRSPCNAQRLATPRWGCFVTQPQRGRSKAAAYATACCGVRPKLPGSALTCSRKFLDQLSSSASRDGMKSWGMTLTLQCICAPKTLLSARLRGTLSEIG